MDSGRQHCQGETMSHRAITPDSEIRTLAYCLICAPLGESFIHPALFATPADQSNDTCCCSLPLGDAVLESLVVGKAKAQR